MCQALFWEELEGGTESGKGLGKRMIRVGSRWGQKQPRAQVCLSGMSRWQRQAGHAVLSCLAEQGQPPGLFLAQFHLPFIGFLLLVPFPRDKSIHSKTGYLKRADPEMIGLLILCPFAPTLRLSGGDGGMSFLWNSLSFSSPVVMAACPCPFLKS